MYGLPRDLGYALRRMRREPGFTVVMVLTIGIAVGANAAIFAAVRPVVAPRLPFPEPDRIMRIWEQNQERGWTRSSASWHDARDWAAAASSFESMGAYTVWEGNLSTGDGAAQRIQYTLAEPSLFEVLGTSPFLGRALLPEEDDPSRGQVVILSHGIWSRAFGADSTILGRTVHLAGQDLEVVGVMPAAFSYPSTDIAAWKPFGMTPDQGGNRDSYWVSVVGRLADGVSQEAAQAEMTAIGAALEEEYPDTNAGFRPLVEPIEEVAVLSARNGVLLLWGAVGLLILVATANLATLLLARGEARSGEMSIRRHLGAGRGALLLQLMLEATLTAGGGGVLGLLIAGPGVQGVQRLVGGRLSYGLTAELDAAVVVYTVLVTALAGVGFGVLPALRLAGDRGKPTGVRGSARARAGSLASALVSGQTAFAVVILIAAGLLGRSLAELSSVDPGYPLENGLTFRVSPAQEGLARPEAAALLEEIRQQVALLPGVGAVAASNNLPLSGNRWGSEWTEENRVGEPGLRALARVVQPGYLPTLGVPVLQGRTFLPSDDASSEPVAVVSELAVERYWPDANALGALISPAPDNARVPWVRVVGVVGDVEATTLGQGPSPIVYTPFEQSVFGHFGDWGMDFVIRIEGDPPGLAAMVRKAVAQVDPALPVFAVASLEERFASGLDQARALGILMAAFAAVALFLSALGVFGLLAHQVARRSPEIGVRMALGASAAVVVAGVVRRGFILSGTGLLVGVLLATLGGRWVEGLLFGVSPVDPLTYVGIALTLGVVSLVASVGPAWRAAQVDPAEVLRRE